MKIIYKVYHKKYTKDEGVLIGIERVNEESTNWEYNLVGKDEWTLGTIAINPDKGMLVRKQFVVEGEDGELLFEGDFVRPIFKDGESGSPSFLRRGVRNNVSYGHGDCTTSMNYGFTIDNYGNEPFKLKLSERLPTSKEIENNDKYGNLTSIE